MPWTIDDFLKVGQLIGYGLALLTAGFAIWKHHAEVAERSRWEKAKLARDMVAGLDKSDEALAATYMLGAFEGRIHEVVDIGGNKTRFTVTQHEVVAALRPTPQKRSSKQEYICECFDAFLFHLEQWVLAVQNDLVEEDQLRPLVLTFLAGIEPQTGEALKEYARSLKYRGAATLLVSLVEDALARS